MGENMKPSGIAWIGDIPESWEVSKVKFDFVVVNGSTPDSSDYDCWDGQIKWITPADMNETGIIDSGDRSITEFGYNSCGTTLLPKGSIVISSRAPIGKINITTEVLCTNQGCKGLVAKRDNRFTYYLMLAGHNELTLLGRGTTFLELSTYDLTNFKIVIPPLHEQTLIADFLDEQCEKIDSISTNLEKQIEILQKYKKSLITETVTKGLNKSVHMKDSGIEWIGDIPEHWEVKRIKHCCTIIGSGTTPESSNFEYYDGDYAWIQSGDLYGRDIIISTEKTITQLAANTYSTLKMYQADYVVVAMYGASVGNVAISKIDAYVNQACCVLAQDSRSDVRYLFYWLVHCKEDLIQQSFGGGQPNISQQKIRNEPMLSLPLDDQIQIANYLDEKCTKIDSIIVSKKEQLTKITQHKKSLIYEYVTGKKRVKGAHSNGN